MKKHYIAHTHWDREWYRSENEFKPRLYLSILSVVKELEENKEFKYFVLDGQTEILETIEQIDDNLSTRIKKLVEGGQLLIGPWYTQPDMNLVDGESIISNLLIGDNVAKKYGNKMNVLWNPDTFFQSPITSRFVNEFSMLGVFAWRNFANDNISDFTFKWHGVDGSICNAVTFPLGYGYHRYLNKNLEIARNEQEQFIKNINNKFKNNKNPIFLMGGSDHSRIDTSITKFLKNNEDIIFSNPEKYITEANFENVETFIGMPTSFKAGRIHLGIGSTRIDIKQYNLKQQHDLAKIVSPINCIITSLGGENMEVMIEKAWKELHKNQFHDSIYSSSPEKVNNEVLNRYLTNEQLISEIKYLFARHIIKNYKFDLKEDCEYVVLFNPSPYPKMGDIDLSIKSQFENIDIFFGSNTIDYIKREKEFIDYESSDYMGLTSLAGKQQVLLDSNVEYGGKFEHFIKIENFELPPLGYKVLEVTKSKIENNKVEKNNDIDVNISNNMISLKLGNDTLNIDFETKIDDGDSYNFSSPNNSEVEDFKLDSYKNGTFIFVNKAQKINLNITEKNDYYKLNITVDSERNDVLTTLNIGKIEKNPSSVIHFINDECKFYDKYKSIDWKKECFVEKPLPIYLFNRHITTDKLDLCCNTTNEFHYEEEKIKLVLLRSIGYMGKIDLNYRPGRASGYVLETPSSQIKHTIEHEVFITKKHIGPSILNNIIIKPEVRQITPTVFENYSNTMANVFSLLEITNEDIVFETAKVNVNGILLRFSSPYNEMQCIYFTKVSKVFMSNFAEEKLEEIKNKKVEFRDIVTLIIEL